MARPRKKTPKPKATKGGRAWLLVWLLALPAAMLLGAAAQNAYGSYRILTTYKLTQGEVVRLYSWDGWTPWTGPTTTYSPVFRYMVAPVVAVQPSSESLIAVEASTGQSSSDWNYDLGTYVPILVPPNAKGDVKLPVFEQLWALPVTLAGLGALLALPAALLAWRLRRATRPPKEKRP